MSEITATKTVTRVRSLVERGERITRDDCRALWEVRDLIALAKLARIPRERRFGRNAFIAAAHVVQYGGEHPEFFLSEAITSAPTGSAFIAIRCNWQPGEGLQQWVERVVEFSRGEMPTVVYMGAGSLVRLALSENISVERVIGELSERGAIRITADEAELFDPGYRSEYSPGVISPEQWIQAHRAAHRLGLKTAAGMAYGTIEHPGEYASHLQAIRDLQEETGGFDLFIPMAIHNRGIESYLTAPTAAGSLRAAAISRIFLDNISHIATAPALITTEVAIMALDHGADLVDMSVWAEDVRSEDRRSSPGGELRVLDAGGASLPGVDSQVVRERMVEAHWTVVDVDASISISATDY